MPTSHDYCLIMAGGVGTRFWPLSRRRHPKQFLDILGRGTTLFQDTVARAAQVVPPEHIYVITNEEYRTLAHAQAPEIPQRNILGEPMMRNTAPAVAYGVYKIHVHDPHARVFILPADHYIDPIESFADDIREAVEMVDAYEGIITLGIRPTYPATGYGYIQVKATERVGRFYRAVSFLEKPNIELARQFVQSDEFYWNAGIFIAATRILIEAYRLYLPTIYQQFSILIPRLKEDREAEVLETVYAMLPSISIDYGIMEKCRYVLCLPAGFQWSDVGTWRAVYQFAPKDDNGNAVFGKNIHLRKSSRTLVFSDDADQLIVLNEMENVLVVQADNAILISPLDRDQEIRSVVNEITAYYGSKYV